MGAGRQYCGRSDRNDDGGNPEQCEGDADAEGYFGSDADPFDADHGVWAAGDAAVPMLQDRETDQDSPRGFPELDGREADADGRVGLVFGLVWGFPGCRESLNSIDVHALLCYSLYGSYILIILFCK